MNYLVTGMFTYDMGDRLWVFFSTISANLEPDGWGTKYPVLLKSLCDKGVVEVSELNVLKAEVEDMAQEFEKLKIKNLVLDYENLSKTVEIADSLLEEPISLVFDLGRHGDLLNNLKLAIDTALKLSLPLNIDTRIKIKEMYKGELKYIYIASSDFGYRTDGKLMKLFNTISEVLEPDGWGTKYPVLLKSLCDKGVVEVSALDDLKKELESVYQEFESRDLLKDFKRIDMDVDLVKLLLKVVDIAEEDSTPVEIRDDEYAKEWIVA